VLPQRANIHEATDETQTNTDDAGPFSLVDDGLCGKEVVASAKSLMSLVNVDLS
jgi:hypothetical protein